MIGDNTLVQPASGGQDLAGGGAAQAIYGHLVPSS
jgi:hypothetical protein